MSVNTKTTSIIGFSCYIAHIQKLLVVFRQYGELITIFNQKYVKIFLPLISTEYEKIIFSVFIIFIDPVNHYIISLVIHKC